jgi:hypothetical protein
VNAAERFLGLHDFTAKAVQEILLVNVACVGMYFEVDCD